MSWKDTMWPNYGAPGLTLREGNGTQVTDDQGNTYTDLLGGIAVNILGHAHPAIVEAVQQQITRLGHTSNLYANPQVLALAERLQGLWPGSKAFFCNSGTEANEAALKVMRRHAHAHDRADGVILAFHNGFHGRTAGTLALTGNPKHQEGCGPLVPQVVHVPFNDVNAILKAFTEHNIVGVFAEVIQGEGGIHAMTQEMADTLQEQCDAHDALLCIDEVQTGIGRTGRFFAFEHMGLEPHIVTLAKGLGGGLPIGATLLREDLTQLMAPGTHGSTFGGNPVACAAANAVLDTIAHEELISAAQTKGEALQMRLREAGLASRGAGLLIGIDVDDVKAVVRRMQDEGFLVGQAGTNTVRLAPALNIAPDELEAAVDALVRVSLVPAR